MAFIEDLPPYTYLHPGDERAGTVNIGWLDRRHSFPTGETGEDFRAKLRKPCRRRVREG
jgi:hypothetical protein